MTLAEMLDAVERIVTANWTNAWNQAVADVNAAFARLGCSAGADKTQAVVSYVAAQSAVTAAAALPTPYAAVVALALAGFGDAAAKAAPTITIIDTTLVEGDMTAGATVEAVKAWASRWTRFAKDAKAATSPLLAVTLAEQGAVMDQVIAAATPSAAATALAARYTAMAAATVGAAGKAGAASTPEIQEQP